MEDISLEEALEAAGIPLAVIETEAHAKRFRTLVDRPTGGVVFLWKLTNIRYDFLSYGMYDSAVVAAITENEARHTHPNGRGEGCFGKHSLSDYCWCDSPEEVEVTCIGEAHEGTPPGVIVASFNAG